MGVGPMLEFTCRVQLWEYYFEHWVSYFVSVSLCVISLSIIWLFATNRLYEPNTPWKYLEMSVAGLFAAFGAGWAMWNFEKCYRAGSAKLRWMKGFLRY